MVVMLSLALKREKLSSSCFLVKQAAALPIRLVCNVFFN